MIDSFELNNKNRTMCERQGKLILRGLKARAKSLKLI